MNKRWVSVWTSAFVLMLALLSCWVSAAAQQGDGKPEIIPAMQHDVSPPLRDIPPVLRREGRRVIPLRPTLPQQVAPAQPDPVLQTSVSAQVATTAGKNLDGVGVGFTGPGGSFTPNAAPPDTNGAVGATQFVQWVNESFAVFDKATGTPVLGPVAGNTLWSGFGGGCETNNDGDPIVQYDKAANRWVMTQFSVSTQPFLQCVAVSTTSDATGPFNRYAFTMPNFPDYPKLGAWPDAYYISFNMFSGNFFAGARACALDRSAMLIGNAATAVCFQLSSSFASLLPSDLDGSNAPPTGSPNFFLNFGSNSLNLWKFHVNFTTPSSSTFTGPTNIPVAAFTQACGGGTCIPQVGTRQQLDSLGDRLMYRLAYRNFLDHEALVVNHSVTAGTSVGVRWYELRSPNGAPTVFQQGTFAPDTSYRWMGSIAMDKVGNIAVGYSVSSSQIHPAIRFTGRAPTDPAGTLQAESSIIEGTGSQTRNLNRWGDYSSMSIDPVDDCTFWYTTEYLKTDGIFNWSTRIASFTFPSCGVPAAPDFFLSATPASQSVNPGASTSYTVTVSPSGGFTGDVALSVTAGLPAGANATFNPATVAGGSGSSTMTVTTSSTTPAGTFTLTITGTSGAGASAITHTTSVTLAVNAPVAADFALSASPTNQVVKRGASANYTVTVSPSGGFTGDVALGVTSGLPANTTASFSPPTVLGGSGSSLLTVTTTSTTPTGDFTLTITGTSGALSHTTSVSLKVR